MKARTIKRELGKKFNNFCESISSEEVRLLVQKNSIITGGSIASMLLNEPVNDFDIYFTNQKTAKAVAEYFVAEFKKTHDDYRHVELVVGKGEEGASNYRPIFEDDRVWLHIPSEGVAGEIQPGIAGETLSGESFDECEQQETESKAEYKPVFLSQNAITLSDKIQLVIRFFGDPETIHENYDFAHCTNYWLSGSGSLVLRPAALEALLTKELVYIGSKYPVCSIIRTRKFIKRGYSVTAGTLLKMILQCNELDLFDLNILEDQLVGVDSAYFMQVISLVKETSPERINAAYLNEIIDRIFS